MTTSRRCMMWTAWLGMAALSGLLTGCSSAPTARDTRAAEIAQREADDKAWRIKREVEDRWENRMKEPVALPAITVDGRNVIVKRYPMLIFKTLSNGQVQRQGPAVYKDGRTIQTWEGGFFELLDADSGKVLLPLDYWDIVPVPGDGIYVHTPEDRFVINKRNNQDAADLARPALAQAEP